MFPNGVTSLSQWASEYRATKRYTPSDSIWMRAYSTVLLPIECVWNSDARISPSSERNRIGKRDRQTDGRTDAVGRMDCSIALCPYRRAEGTIITTCMGDSRGLGIGRSVTRLWVCSSVRVSVCLSVRVLKGKRLQLSTPYMAGPSLVRLHDDTTVHFLVDQPLLVNKTVHVAEQEPSVAEDAHFHADKRSVCAAGSLPYLTRRMLWPRGF